MAEPFPRRLPSHYLVAFSISSRDPDWPENSSEPTSEVLSQPPSEVPSQPPSEVPSEPSNETDSIEPSIEPSIASYESAATDTYKWSRWTHWDDFDARNLPHFLDCYHDTRICLPRELHKPNHDAPIWTDCAQGMNMVIARGYSIVLNRTLKYVCEKLEIPRCFFTTGWANKGTGAPNAPDWAGTTGAAVDTRAVDVPCLVRLTPPHLETALDKLTANPDLAGQPWVYSDPVFKHIGRCVYDLWLMARAWDTRYGYIMTGDEIIVVRFSNPLVDHEPTDADFGLPPYEISIVPYSGVRDYDRMTSVHAIVLIHILASLSNDIRAEYLPLEEDPEYACLQTKLERKRSIDDISLLDLNA